MAPKQKEGKSKKAIREKSAQIVSDNTFGLKNKNKSSKVQKFVKQVEVAVKHSDGTSLHMTPPMYRIPCNLSVP